MKIKYIFKNNYLYFLIINQNIIFLSCLVYFIIKFVYQWSLLITIYIIKLDNTD